MAEQDTLLRTLPPEVHDDVEKLYAADAAASPDPRDVVAELHKRGLLSAGQLRDAVLSLEANLTIRRVRSDVPEAAAPTILGELGQGAMGEVLIGRDEGLNRVVAVKRLHPERAGSKGLIRRFYTEAQITAQLDHPGIVPIHAVLRDSDGALSYTMKLVRGVELEEYFDEAREGWKKGTPDQQHSLPARLERFLHVCDAVAYAHDKGVLHRDLKPENIMVGAFGEVLVMDWGIAKLLDNPTVEITAEDGTVSERDANKTQIGRVIGTPRYMAPEQASGRTDKLDGTTDQYSLGVILQELVTLQPGVRATLTLDEALEWAQKARREPMAPYKRGAECPRELMAIVDKACSLKQAQRYKSVNDLAEDVRRYLRDEAVLAKPDSMGQRLHRWVGRHRTLMVLAVSSLMTLLLAAAVFVMLFGGATVAGIQLRASHREALVTVASTRAHEGAARADAAATDVSRLLTGLSFAGERGLGPIGEADIPWELGQPPPGRKSAKLYDKSMAVDRPTLDVPKGQDAGQHFDILKKLAVLGPQLGRVLVDSGGKSGDRLSKQKKHQLVANEGVPIVWSRIATKEGPIATAPGMHGLRYVSDPRDSAWFRGPRDTRGLTWSEPKLDPDGQGVVLTASYPMFENAGRVLGVSSVDVTLDHFASLLEPPKGCEAYIIDSGGSKVVWEKMKARDAKKYKPKRSSSKELIAAVKSRSSGGIVELGGGQVAAWARIGTLNWAYVVEGDLGALGLE